MPLEPGQLQFFAILASLTVSAWLLVRARRMVRRRSESPGRPPRSTPARPTSAETYARQARSAIDSAGQPAPHPATRGQQEFDRWAVEMDELARELTGRLNTKIGILQELLRRADERIAHLERLAAQGGGPARPEARIDHSQPGRAPHFAAPSATAPVSATAAPKFAAAGAITSGAIAGGGGQPTGRSLAAQRQEEVCDLADAGLAPAEIAEKLLLPVGEVELILGLRWRG